MGNLKDVLQDLLKERNINAPKLANEIGVSKNTIYNILQGHHPKTNTLMSIATYFKVTTDYLLYGTKKGFELVEEQLLEDYRKLDYKDKLEILGQLSKLRSIQLNKETLKKDYYNYE